MNTFIIINMSLSKALCLAGILLATTVSADCFDSCNTTMDYCHNNPVVDQTVCTNGDSACLTRCYNTAPEFQWGQPVYANNCTLLSWYVEFANNQTSHDLMTRCMYRAFEAKGNSSGDTCTENCDSASGLCNYTQYINFTECKQQASKCYLNCFNTQRKQQVHVHSANHKQSLKAKLRAPLISCDACMFVADGYNSIIQSNPCDHWYKMKMGVRCEAALRNAGEEAIATCTSIFEKACEPLRWFFSGSAFNAKEACADLKLC
ncbi:hypothetical protein FGO68_gene16244 [Halteria grandinella]|uniref:Saposin B-type domain-containing protein n=1 Tax=Halteria grandinella TaxID=5974 RepID=A0A8J8NJW4_HALGN|nr:hypothetical protein FGO68_gene16244 [Halteria grandinella]